MSNEELVMQFQSGDGGSLEELCNQNRRLVFYFANKYQSLAELDDLEQEGFIALIQAAKLYNPAAGTAFSSYAGLLIKQRLLRYIAENDTVRVPEVMQNRYREYQQIRQKLVRDWGIEPNLYTIARIMGLSHQQLERTLRDIEAAATKSLESNVTDDLDLMDMVADERQDVEGVVLDQEGRKKAAADLWQFIDTALTTTQARIIKAYYREQKSKQEIAEELGITSASLNYKKHAAIASLYRQRDKIEHIAEAYDIATAQAYRGSAAAFSYNWTSSTENAALRIYEADRLMERMKQEKAGSF